MGLNGRGSAESCWMNLSNKKIDMVDFKSLNQFVPNFLWIISI